jgi:nitroreductase
VLHDATSFERHPSQGSEIAASAEALQFLFRERRSVRNYTEDPVPQEILNRILDAGRYGPTGSNSQNVHYVVLKSPDQISQLREMTIRFHSKIYSWARGRLSGILFSLIAGRKTLDYLRDSFPKIEYAYEQMRKGEDRLFYHAPVVLLTHAESWDICSSFNCSVALYNCSLMAHTFGLGCCFNGYLVSAVNHDRKIKRWLGVPGGHQCYSAMTLGYRKIKYQRLVHRDPPRVAWR